MHEALELIEDKIEKIDAVVDQYGSVVKALEDETLARPAILMHLTSIAEQFGRLQNAMAYEILSRFDKEDVRGAFAVRNFIAHDYEGVNLAIIEGVIREYLPRIREIIHTIDS
jgi:uncharacterized protein with HEPN domain